jgi:hypothetical protein
LGLSDLMLKDIRDIFYSQQVAGRNVTSKRGRGSRGWDRKRSHLFHVIIIRESDFE